MPRGTCSAGHPEGSALESGEPRHPQRGVLLMRRPSDGALGREHRMPPVTLLAPTVRRVHGGLRARIGRVADVDLHALPTVRRHGSHRSRSREGLDARSVLDLPGMRPPLLDDVSAPENGLCHPPAQWKEGTLPSRRHLRRHVPECPRSLSGAPRSRTSGPSVSYETPPAKPQPNDE